MELLIGIVLLILCLSHSITGKTVLISLVLAIGGLLLSLITGFNIFLLIGKIGLAIPIIIAITKIVKAVINL